MKRILVINQFASLPKYSYGEGERMYHMAKFLPKDGFEITVISGAYNHLFKTFPYAEDVYNIEYSSHAKYVWIKLRKYNPLSFVGRVFSWFEFLYRLFRFKITD